LATASPVGGASVSVGVCTFTTLQAVPPAQRVPWARLPWRLRGFSGRSIGGARTSVIPVWSAAGEGPKEAPAGKLESRENGPFCYPITFNPLSSRCRSEAELWIAGG